MSGSAIGQQLGFGYPGNISRMASGTNTQAKPVKSDSANIYFGDVVVLNTDNTYSSAKTVTCTAAIFAGIARGEVTQNNSYSVGVNQGTSAYYAPLQPCDVVTNGFVIVNFNGFGTPTAGGAAYVRTVLNSSYPDSFVGDIEAASDSGKNVVIPNAKFATGIVNGGVVELHVLTDNN